MGPSEKNTWGQLTLPFNEGIWNVLQQLHHAAQYIALVGKYLIPQQPDDSNTNMHYLSERPWMYGNRMPGGLSLGLGLEEQKLCLVDQNDKSLSRINLTGFTKLQGFRQLKQMLSDHKLDVSDFSSEMHYEIPTHDLDNEGIFTSGESSHIQENILYRKNAELILNKFAATFEQAGPVRIWPHHFDSATFVPLGYGKDGSVSRSMGLGWAIPDDLVNEPYYYLRLWSADPIADFKDLPVPDAGEWNQTGWKGGILKNSDIVEVSSSAGQQKLTESFFESGIRILREKSIIP